jgi:hypothetical protein
VAGGLAAVSGPVSDGGSRRARLAARLRGSRADRVEAAAVLALAAAYTIRADDGILRGGHTVQTDAMVHEWWMRRFQDAELFTDPLTAAFLDANYAPAGVRALLWTASHAVDPVRAAAWLGVGLAALSTWLLLRAVREHTDWRPAGWLGAALFLVALDQQRFSGGHPRAFGAPIVLVTLVLLLRRRDAAAAAAPPVGMLLYPPAALVAVGVVALAPLRRARGRIGVDRRRVVAAAASVAAVAAVAGAVALLGERGDLLSAAEARRYPEFRAGGQMAFFRDSLVDQLAANYSGFDLRGSGSILAVTALVLLVARPRNALALRWETWALAISSLALFALSYAVLFELYLPNRYARQLLPFLCIAIAVAWRPTGEALARRLPAPAVVALAVIAPLALAYAGLDLFPLRAEPHDIRLPQWLWQSREVLAAALVAAAAIALARALLRRRAGPAAALTAGALVVAGGLLAGTAAAAAGTTNGGRFRCEDAALLERLARLPKDAIVAGDPVTVDCVPVMARRAVVISHKLYQVFDAAYLAVARPRMRDMIDAYYGASPARLGALRVRYGADVLVVDTRDFTSAPAPGWDDAAPFTQRIARLLATVERPAALRLDPRCRIWAHETISLFDLACAGRAPPPSG